MAPHSLDGQLIKYLTDAHSIECQALVQMRISLHEQGVGVR